MDKLLGNAPPPLQDEVLGSNGRMSDSWNKYASRFPDTFNAIPSKLNVVALTGQTGVIGATDFSGGSIADGVYRLTFSPFATPNPATVTLRWTDGGAARSLAGTSAATILVHSDAAPITYEVSLPGGATTYSLYVLIEKIKA